MNKYKKLVGNSFIFAIGNLGSKLMQFIMIPLYSYTLTTAQYGKVDLLTTLVGLFVPIISLDIFDAVFRYALDKDDNQTTTFNTGLLFTLLVSVASIPIALILQFFIKGYPIGYTDYVLIATMLFSLISNYARAVNRVREFAVAGIINSFVMGILNIILLLVLKFKMDGYLFSMATGMVVATLYLLASCKLFNQIDFSIFNRRKFKEMLRYSIPLVPNLLAWWLNSASDRVFILAFLGASANGIYAMASKIPNILSTLMTIFLQSWQISVVQEYDGKEGKKFITNVFQVFITLMFVIAIAIVALIKPIFSILVSHSYYIGWQVAPFLLLSIIYSNLSGFLGTIYTATKKTVPIMYTTLVGAVVNVVMSLILIPTLNINGAALANIISFAVVSCLRIKDIINDNKISIKAGHLLFLHGLFILCALVNYFSGVILPAIIGGLITVLILVFDKNLTEVRQVIFQKFFNKQ